MVCDFNEESIVLDGYGQCYPAKDITTDAPLWVKYCKCPTPAGKEPHEVQVLRRLVEMEGVPKIVCTVYVEDTKRWIYAMTTVSEHAMALYDFINGGMVSLNLPVALRGIYNVIQEAVPPSPVCRTMQIKQCYAHATDVVPDEVRVLRDLSDMVGVPKLTYVTYIKNDQKWIYAMTPFGEHTVDLVEFVERGVINLPMVLRGIYDVMAELLARGYMPRDLQPTNFLVDYETLKVTMKDYGSLSELEGDPYSMYQLNRWVWRHKDILMVPEHRPGIIPAERMTVCFGLIAYFLATTRSLARQNCQMVCCMMSPFSRRRLWPVWNRMREKIAQLRLPVGKLIKSCLVTTPNNRIRFTSIKEWLQSLSENEKDVVDE